MTVNSGTSWNNPVTIKAASGATLVMDHIGLGTHGGGGPSYGIFDGIIVDGNVSGGGGLDIRTNSATHHIRFTNGEIKNTPHSNGVSLFGARSMLTRVRAAMKSPIARFTIIHGTIMELSPMDSLAMVFTSPTEITLLTIMKFIRMAILVFKSIMA
jgi:hypothetical protein